jgi:thiol peroxidase
LLLFTACADKKARIVVNNDSIQPGSVVHKGSQQFQLIGTPLKVGMTLPETILMDGFTMKEFSFSKIRNKIAVVSIVPSIDTKVCEAQTHYLGEEGDRLPATIVRITVSRDTPFAQKRFAEAARLTDIQYVSDHRDASFGMATGLLIDKTRLLARGVLVIDKSGMVQYMQIVSQLGELPDMEKAFDFAIRLSQQP